jgi:hypothetical protein
MIMSISVLNKVKILSQISPHLVSPNLASPQPEIRGAIVAVEGLDPESVWDMTNSLAEQLSKDRKFAVKVFNGPDPFVNLRTESKAGRKELAIADCLNVIGEWHKISDEMKRYITTRPVTEVEDDDATISKYDREQRNSVTMVDLTSGSARDDARKKTPNRDHRPTKLDLQPPEKTKANELDAEPPASGMSNISPKTIIANKTADLSITTSPPRKDSVRNPWSKGAGDWDNPDSPPYTRIPNLKHMMRSSPEKQTETNTTGDTDADMGDVITVAGEKDKQKDEEAHVHFSPSTSSTPNMTKASISSPHRPSLASPYHSMSDPNVVIPIALVPHFQLSTVDASAIAMPIVDSYSPLAHWQWLATLWRGCVGPDVSVVIKHTCGVGAETGSIAGVTSADGSPGKIPTAVMLAGAVPRPRTESIAAGASNASATPNPASAATPATNAPGVEVRLTECRAVVVRTNVLRLRRGSRAGSVGADGKSSSEGSVASTAAEEKKRNEELDLWEKAKRRVGFEVAEFVRK